MARPKKAIVEYFPHFVNHGKTMFTIESKYGNDGYSFYFKMLELLGSSEQHYLDCNNTETWEFLLAKTRITEIIALEILDKLAKLDSIDQKLWSIKIIRSNNFIQNLDAVYKRRSISVINNDQLYSFCMQKLPLSSITVNINPQSRVEYSNVENSKVLDRINEIKNLCKIEKYEVVLNSFEKWRDYLQKQHSISLLENEYTYDVLIDAIKRVKDGNVVKSIDYSINSGTYKKIYPFKEDIKFNVVKSKEQKHDETREYVANRILEATKGNS